MGSLYYSFSFLLSPNRCFIGNTATFFAAFLGPIMAVVVFNCVIFVMVIIVLIRHKRRSKQSGLKSSEGGGSIIRLMISVTGIMSLFGLTWIFGALTVDKASLAFQVIFVILNSLQGFFIFLFLCVSGRDARELWLELLCCGRYKSSYLHPSSAPTSSAGKKTANILLSCNTLDQYTEKTDPSKENAYVTIDTKGEGEGNGSKNSSFHNGGHLEKCASPEHHFDDPVTEPSMDKPHTAAEDSTEGLDDSLSDSVPIKQYSTKKRRQPSHGQF